MTLQELLLVPGMGASVQEDELKSAVPVTLEEKDTLPVGADLLPLVSVSLTVAVTLVGWLTIVPGLKDIVVVVALVLTMTLFEPELLVWTLLPL